MSQQNNILEQSAQYDRGPITQRVVFKEDARQKMLSGAKKLADAVVSTMGPSGHNVIIDYNENGAPLITKDGVTVAKSITLKDKLESIGAELIKEVANKTNEIAGDGTTSSTALAYHMLYKGTQQISTGRNSIFLKKGMDSAVDSVLKFLSEIKTPVSSLKDIENVGTISTNGDRELGKLITDAIESVGKDGIITIEPAKSVHTTLDIVSGMRIESGFVSPFFITNADKANCEFENPLILITANKISSMAEILPAAEIAVKNSRPLLVISDEIEGEALHTLIVNKTKGTLASCAIKAPFFGEHRAEVLADLAALTGAEVIGATSFVKLQDVTMNELGSCPKITVTRNHTTFVGVTDESGKERVENRVNDLRNFLENNDDIDAKIVARTRARIARMSGGIAIIRVGGSTEVEINEKKDRIEDAVNATTAAVQEGILAGGGTALFYAAQRLKKIAKEITATGVLPEGVTGVPEAHYADFVAGYSVVSAACEAPLRIIVENTGNSPDVVISKLLENNNEFNINFGYDARNGVYTDLIEAGILDPYKVTRSAITHAASVSGLMLTCNAVVFDEE